MARFALGIVFLLSSLLAGPAQTSAQDQTIHGIASHYCCTRGFGDQVVLALAGGLGGRYTGKINTYVTVCADRCAVIPVVDYCQCFWGTSNQRLVDLTPAAWVAISDDPLSRGLIPVTVTFGGPSSMLPDTAYEP